MNMNLFNAVANYYCEEFEESMGDAMDSAAEAIQSGEIGLAYTTVGECDEDGGEHYDKEHDVQVTAHLDDLTLTVSYDFMHERVVARFDTLDDLADDINDSDFDSYYALAHDYAPKDWLF